MGSVVWAKPLNSFNLRYNLDIVLEYSCERLRTLCSPPSFVVVGAALLCVHSPPNFSVLGPARLLRERPSFVTCPPNFSVLGAARGLCFLRLCLCLLSQMVCFLRLCLLSQMLCFLRQSEKPKATRANVRQQCYCMRQSANVIAKCLNGTM